MNLMVYRKLSSIQTERNPGERREEIEASVEVYDTRAPRIPLNMSASVDLLGSFQHWHSMGIQQASKELSPTNAISFHLDQRHGVDFVESSGNWCWNSYQRPKGDGIYTSGKQHKVGVG